MDSRMTEENRGIVRYSLLPCVQRGSVMNLGIFPAILCLDKLTTPVMIIYVFITNTLRVSEN
jgi:hypothetical protein